MLSSKTTGRPSPGYVLWRTLMGGILALVVAMGIGRFAYTPILSAMQERFDLTNTAAAALASSNYLGYLLGAVLAAFVPVSRWQNTLLQASLLTVAASTALMALSVEFSAWLALRFLAGVGSAGILVLASTMVLNEFAQLGRPGLSGWLYSGVGLSIVLSGLVILLLNRLLTEDPVVWRIDWICLGTFATLLVALCWVWLPRKAVVPPPAASSQSSVRRANQSSAELPLAIVLLCVAYFLEGGGYIVTGTFLPAIVEGLPGLGGLGTDAWILVGLAAAPSTVLWAKAASRVGPVAVLVVAYAVQAVGIFLPVVSTAWWAAAISAMLFGGTFVGISAPTLTYAQQMAGPRRVGLTIGLLTAAYGVGQVLGPMVAASLMGNTTDFRPAVASAAVTLGSLLLPAIVLSGVRRKAALKEAEAGPERSKRR